MENISGPEGNDFSPHPSPDGRRLAFQSDRDGIHDIFVMGLDGSNPVNLTAGAGGFSPQFSPDGSRIAFNRWGTEGNDIFVVNVDGSGLTNLTQSPGDDRLLSWSPR